MSSERLATPPPQLQDGNSGAKSPPTPEQTRRMEINRLKAKALREQREAEVVATPKSPDNSVVGQKRSFAAFAQTPATVRDGRTDSVAPDRPLEAIKPARNFAKYVEYDFSKMTDTKGGFLTVEDDPHNEALHAKDDEESKPANMTMKEWERQQTLRSLRNQKAGPFEPGISVLKDTTTKCRECGILEIDWKWDEVFGISVCNACKDKFPDKYSLLTKTEAREDYLLTDRKFWFYIHPWLAQLLTIASRAQG
jgi:DNA-repair protein complementing XP-A cells